MKYADAWEELKKQLEQDANATGEMMSTAEWTWVTMHARNTLALMDRLEEEYE